ITANGTTVPITGQLPDSLVDTGTSEFLLNTTAYGAIVAAIQSDAMFTQVFGASFFPPAGTQSPACASVTQTKAALDAALPALTLTFGTSPAITVKAVEPESYL